MISPIQPPAMPLCQVFSALQAMIDSQASPQQQLGPCDRCDIDFDEIAQDEDGSTQHDAGTSPMDPTGSLHGQFWGLPNLADWRPPTHAAHAEGRCTPKADEGDGWTETADAGNTWTQAAEGWTQAKASCGSSLQEDYDQRVKAIQAKIAAAEKSGHLNSKLLDEYVRLMNQAPKTMGEGLPDIAPGGARTA